MTREEAIKRIKDWNLDDNDMEVLSTLIPELKENEDERIRKSLINFLDDVWHRGKNANFDEYSKADCADWMNWLEKKKDANKEYWRGYREGKQEVLEKYAETEMQSKQKPANARKFKVGNWIVYCNEDVDLITGIEEKGYRINEGGYIPFACENNMRLWTIQDAKDGDVLATKNFIFIFKNIDSDNGVSYYCHYEISGHEEDNLFEVALPLCWMGRVGNGISYYSPATKEQRDLLFSKMKETGYEWDAEDKVLRKIEQTPAAYFYCKYGGTIPKCSGCIRNHLNSKYKTEEIKTWMTPASRGTKQCSDYIPKDSVKWSVEDEGKLRTAQTFIRNTSLIEVDGIKEATIDWLKSLKERVQPQHKF